MGCCDSKHAADAVAEAAQHNADTPSHGQDARQSDAPPSHSSRRASPDDSLDIPLGNTGPTRDAHTDESHSSDKVVAKETPAASTASPSPRPPSVSGAAVPEANTASASTSQASSSLTATSEPSVTPEGHATTASSRSPADGDEGHVTAHRPTTSSRASSSRSVLVDDVVGEAPAAEERGRASLLATPHGSTKTSSSDSRDAAESPVAMASESSAVDPHLAVVADADAAIAAAPPPVSESESSRSSIPIREASAVSLKDVGQSNGTASEDTREENPSSPVGSQKRKGSLVAPPALCSDELDSLGIEQIEPHSQKPESERLYCPSSSSPPLPRLQLSRPRAPLIEPELPSPPPQNTAWTASRDSFSVHVGAGRNVHRDLSATTRAHTPTQQSRPPVRRATAPSSLWSTADFTPTAEKRGSAVDDADHANTASASSSLSLPMPLMDEALDDSVEPQRGTRTSVESNSLVRDDGGPAWGASTSQRPHHTFLSEMPNRVTARHTTTYLQEMWFVQHLNSESEQ